MPSRFCRVRKCSNRFYQSKAKEHITHQSDHDPTLRRPACGLTDSYSLTVEEIARDGTLSALVYNSRSATRPLYQVRRPVDSPSYVVADGLSCTSAFGPFVVSRVAGRSIGAAACSSRRNRRWIAFIYERFHACGHGGKAGETF